MKQRNHLILATAAAVGLAPWLGGLAVPLWLGASFTDVDLYACYVVRHRRLSARAAVRYYSTLTGRREKAVKVLHHPAVPVLALVAGRRVPVLGAVGAGVALHQVADRWSKRRYLGMVRVLRRRGAGECELCGWAQRPIALMEPYYVGEHGDEDWDPARWRLICRPCSEAQHDAQGIL